MDKTRRNIVHKWLNSLEDDIIELRDYINVLENQIAVKDGIIKLYERYVNNTFRSGVVDIKTLEEIGALKGSKWLDE